MRHKRPDLVAKEAEVDIGKGIDPSMEKRIANLPLTAPKHQNNLRWSCLSSGC